MSLQGGRRISPEAAGAVALSDTIKAVVGTTAVAITKPVGDFKLLCLQAAKGDWAIRLGDFHTSGMPAAAVPSVAVTDGTGGWRIPEGRELVIPCTGTVTVKGYASDSALSYFWL